MTDRERDAARWLRADLGDVVQVVPREARTGPRDGARVELSDGLRRWSGRLARQRSLAVARRQLLLGGTLAALAALVILIVGGARPWWLAAAGLAFGFGCGAITWVRRPSPKIAAQLLDRELATHDRLGTALELQALGASRGLAGVVRGEADVAIGRSLSQARAKLSPAGREWAWLAVVVLALAILIAVPRGSSAPVFKTAPGARAPGHVVIPPGGRVTLPGKAGNPNAAGFASNPVQDKESKTSFTNGNGANPYHYNGKQYKNNAPAQSVHPGQIAKPPKLNLTSIGSNTPGGSGGASGNRGAAGGGGKSGSSAHSGAGQTGAKLGNPSAGGSGGAGAGGLKPSGGNGQSTGNSSPSGSSSASQGSQQGSGGAPPGGESAGSDRAPALGQSTGISSALGKNNTALPLQGSFKPVAGKGAGQKGNQQEQGGGGASRTATVGATGGGGSSNFAALAPTFNSPTGDASITSYYFGTANQLDFKGW